MPSYVNENAFVNVVLRNQVTQLMGLVSYSLTSEMPTYTVLWITVAPIAIIDVQ